MAHWIPFYIGDYEKDTKSLNQQEDGAYFRLLRHIWTTGELIPLEEQEIFRIAGAFNPDEQQSTLRVLSKFFVKKSHGFYQKKAFEVYKEQQERIQKAKENGAKGGRPRKNPGVNPEVNPKVKRSANLNESYPQPDLHTQQQITEQTSSGNRDNNHDACPPVSPLAKPPMSKKIENEAEFEEWYKAYPRKREKGDARKAYWKARKKVSAEQLLEAAKKYALVPNEPKYIKFPATWLNKQCWDDELETEGIKSTPAAPFWQRLQKHRFVIHIENPSHVYDLEGFETKNIGGNVYFVNKTDPKVELYSGDLRPERARKDVV